MCMSNWILIVRKNQGVALTVFYTTLLFTDKNKFCNHPEVILKAFNYIPLTPKMAVHDILEFDYCTS